MDTGSAKITYQPNYFKCLKNSKKKMKKLRI